MFICDWCRVCLTEVPGEGRRRRGAPVDSPESGWMHHRTCWLQDQGTERGEYAAICAMVVVPWGGSYKWSCFSIVGLHLLFPRLILLYM